MLILVALFRGCDVRCFYSPVSMCSDLQIFIEAARNVTRVCRTAVIYEVKVFALSVKQSALVSIAVVHGFEKTTIHVQRTVDSTLRGESLLLRIRSFVFLLSTSYQV